MHSYIEQFLLGKMNLDLLEEYEQYKNMAKEIIDSGLKNKLDEILELRQRFIIQENMQVQQILYWSLSR